MRYVAVFNNGYTMTRNSERTYTHAWKYTHPEVGDRNGGFAGSRALAEKAARTHVLAVAKYSEFTMPYDVVAVEPPS